MKVAPPKVASRPRHLQTRTSERKLILAPNECPRSTVTRIHRNRSEALSSLLAQLIVFDLDARMNSEPTNSNQFDFGCLCLKVKVILGASHRQRLRWGSWIMS